MPTVGWLIDWLVCLFVCLFVYIFVINFCDLPSDELYVALNPLCCTALLLWNWRNSLWPDDVMVGGFVKPQYFPIIDAAIDAPS